MLLRDALLRPASGEIVNDLRDCSIVVKGSTVASLFLLLGRHESEHDEYLAELFAQARSILYEALTIEEMERLETLVHE